MRKIIYNVATSLDGRIADAEGGYDWIIMDPEMDLAAYFSRFDTLLMGRKSYELVLSQEGGLEMYGGLEIVVASRTLDAAVHRAVRIVGEDLEDAVLEMKASEGESIWLFGGGELFRSLLDARLVDTIEVGLIPALVGGGIPLLPAGSGPFRLKLTDTQSYPTGILMLSYDILYEEA